MGKLDELLENSEKISTSLKKQKNQLEKEIEQARRETEIIRKSFQSLRNKYKKSSNSFQIYKKKLWEANEEKVVLQSQIQEYVSRVRNIEDLLLQKEQEREFVFQQFQELSAKDNCGDSFLDIMDNRESPPTDETPPSHSDPIYLANAETQTPAPRRAETDERCGHESTDCINRVTLGTKSSGKGYVAFEPARPEPVKDTSNEGLLTNQLDVMGKTVSSLESQVKMIGQSLDHCRKNCESRETRSSRQYMADSSFSTML
ncbi:hypothetical protein GE061_001215 [Apolygus lucorum]|uniref:Uncharacterized protein n=1 Tax=Apolygus lucorum TaxID=248454 RepID=A0A8S9YCS1_APOLU|nr:hypothetical protein GE061_001215 [Apolygus lucorum]